MAENKLFSVDTELAIISGILNCPALIHSTDGLKYYMFSAEPLKLLFEEFEQLREQNLVPEFQILYSSLESKGKLDKIGGKKQLEQLMQREEIGEESFKKLVEIAVKSYKARSFLSTLSSTKKDDLKVDTIDEQIDQTRRRLEELTGLGGGNHTVHISELTRETYEAIVARMEKPGVRGASWGVKSIDQATGGKSPGDLIVVAGRPGQGKTAVACNSILADGRNEVPSLLISREMRPQQLLERLAIIDSGVNNTNVRLGILNEEQLGKLRESFDNIKKMPIYLDYDMNCNDIFYFESTINKFRKQKGVEVVYLDYIQLATERDDHQTQEIGKLTMFFRRMVNSLGISCVLLSQLNRNVEMRDDKRPLLSDMKQAGAIEDDADFVIGLYRDEYYFQETKAKGIMEYILLKNRHGPPGTFTVKFEGPTYKISDLKG